MADQQLLRQLRIRVGVVVRTEKELASYHKELQDQTEKIEKMKERNEDEFDIKKQVEVLSETEFMIPDTMRRLEKGIDELKEFVATNWAAISVEESEQLDTAKKLLKDHIQFDCDSLNENASVDDDERI